MRPFQSEIHIQFISILAFHNEPLPTEDAINIENNLDMA